MNEKDTYQKVKILNLLQFTHKPIILQNPRFIAKLPISDAKGRNTIY